MGTGVNGLFFFLKRTLFKDFLFLKLVTDRFFSDQPGPTCLLNLKSHCHTLNSAPLSPVACRLPVLTKP